MLGLSEPEALQPTEHVVVVMTDATPSTSLQPARDEEREQPPEPEPETPAPSEVEKPRAEPTPPKTRAKPEVEPETRPETRPKASAKTSPNDAPPRETAAVVVDDTPDAPVVSQLGGATSDSGVDTANTSAHPRGDASERASSSTHITSATPSPGKKSPNLSQMRGAYMRALVPRISKSYYYPAMARRLGQEGRVLVALRIDARGELVDVKVHRSSGHAILDKAAVDALRRLGRLPAPPSELLGKGTLKIIVPMHYNLGASS
jgi:protein TonB